MDLTKDKFTKETVSIVLPLPPSILSPNAVCGSLGGRMKRASATKKFRRLAREAAEREDIKTCPWHKATIKAVFYHKQNRRRDDVNHLAMLKPAYDGLVDANLLYDDDSEHLTTLPAEFQIDKDVSRVELTITRVLT